MISCKTGRRWRLGKALCVSAVLAGREAAIKLAERDGYRGPQQDRLSQGSYLALWLSCWIILDHSVACARL